MEELLIEFLGIEFDLIVGCDELLDVEFYVGYFFDYCELIDVFVGVWIVCYFELSYLNGCVENVELFVEVMGIDIMWVVRMIDLFEEEYWLCL